MHLYTSAGLTALAIALYADTADMTDPLSITLVATLAVAGYWLAQED